ncbi:MAG TPA: error-prone DNA polymerase [Pirellulales bacterium]|jgi:error-prone DNA polymerase|nr:error-prone DNA polymerase [Pirellulales bacterium]
MPELPPSRRRPAVPAVGCPLPSAYSSYAELHCKTNYSFLRGASHPDELVLRAAELGYAALAITDLHSLAGVVRAHVAAKQLGLKLLIGAEIVPRDAPPVVLLATDRAAYGRLARLLTLGKRRTVKGECELYFRDIAEHGEGLLALVRQKSEVRSQKLQQPTPSDFCLLPSTFCLYREAFPGRCYMLAELHRGPDDDGHLAALMERARHERLPLVAAGDVHYHAPDRRSLHDVLTATRLRSTVAASTAEIFANGERHLHAPQQIALRFARCPEAVSRTLEVARRCTFSLDELRYEYPEELSPPGITPLEYLVELTWAGARERYPQGVPDKVRGLLEHELRIIEQLRYEAYFLTVWDLVRFARERKILCQGRGSAANSAVCYCLGVTAVDPERSEVFFERFISPARNEPPDIDVDFEHERREEVLQYLYEKYGRERAGLAASVITYRTRSAVRDVGKALGLSLEQVDKLAKTFDGHGDAEQWKAHCRMAGIDPELLTARQLVPLVRTLKGFPRHLSQHVGGMVITRGPLCELVPIENAAMPDRTVVEWDKDDLDALGILKVDCLCLGMLTAIRKCFALVQQHYDRELSLANIPAEDPKVYEMICRADTIGVFQIESRAQMSMLPRLRPEKFYDLVIEVAIVRPGPIQGNMVHPYLRRRQGLEAVTYPNDEIRAVLHNTLGVPIFQEQAMRLAVVAAGFTPAEADQLRRAMAAWRRSGEIERFQQKLIDGMRAKNLPEQFAKDVFQQISGFGEYGFPESHAASFALLVYVSAWLKHHYPAAFCAAMINSQPMGFYAPAQLVRDAREHGVTVLPVDVNASEEDCTLEMMNDKCLMLNADHLAVSIKHLSFCLRLGFRLVAGLPDSAVQAIIAARRSGPFRSLDDFARRTRLGQPWLVRLARAQAFQSLGVDRRGALWESLRFPVDKPRPLFAALEEDAAGDEPRPAVLPRLSRFEEVLADYLTAGMSLDGHPLEFFREALDARRVVRCSQLVEMPIGRIVRVAGLVLVRQRPATASGITFVTLEDETGIANLIVRPHIWQRFRRVANLAGAMIAHGRLERQDCQPDGHVIHVLVHKLEEIGELSRRLGSQSRDFR